MKPNFLVIGAPKCATTALCFNLAMHPDVCVSYPKEPFFFCFEDVWARGWSWYESLFLHAESCTAVGEGSTLYCHTQTYPKALQRIAEHLPHAKIIYLVRHPLERIRSNYVELHSQGQTMLPFNQAVRRDPSYVDGSMYFQTLQAYRHHFADDRILVRFYEDYASDPKKILREVFFFLGVDPSVEIASAEDQRYATKGKRSDRAVTNLLRHGMPGFYRIRDAMPKPLRRLAKRVLKRPIPAKPEWDEPTREWVLEQIGDDARRFLQDQGRSADFWGLASPTPQSPLSSEASTFTAELPRPAESGVPSPSRLSPNRQGMAKTGRALAVGRASQ